MRASMISSSAQIYPKGMRPISWHWIIAVLHNTVTQVVTFSMWVHLISSQPDQGRGCSPPHRKLSGGWFFCSCWSRMSNLSRIGWAGILLSSWHRSAGSSPHASFSWNHLLIIFGLSRKENTTSHPIFLFPYFIPAAVLSKCGILIRFILRTDSSSDKETWTLKLAQAGLMLPAQLHSHWKWVFFYLQIKNKKVVWSIIPRALFTLI